jgi:fructose-1,6-bisphosphatase/sedoheptulose 1,7-bisphosphatase-like protein
LRKQSIKNGIYLNKIIINKKKIIDIKNPMTEYLNSIFRNLDKNGMLKKNNDITLSSIKIMEKLIN